MTNPTTEQRRSLPDAAYAAVLEISGGGKRRLLPHHINTVKSGTDNATVDVPRLRNALAAVGPLQGVGPATRTKAMAHLRTHADSVLRRMDVSEAVLSLAALVSDLDEGLEVAHHFSCHDISGPDASDVAAAGQIVAAVEAFTLLDGETLDAARCALSDAVRAAWGATLGEDDYCYLEAVFDSTLVVYVRRSDQPSTYYRHAWMRAEDGSFVLGVPIEVRAVLHYEPVAAPAPIPATMPMAPSV